MTDLPPDAKLCKMQQNTDGLVQLIGAATPDVLNQTPMPQSSKELLNACPIPPVHVIVTLLAGCQSAILSSDEWHNDMNPAFIGAFISTIMAPNLEIKEITSGTTRYEKVPVSLIAPEGWGPKEGGNATSLLHSRGSPTKGKEKSKPTPGVTMMPLVSKYGSLYSQTPQ